MANIPVTTVAKIIEGALTGDLNKVKAYAQLIADNLEKDGDEHSARIIRQRLDGTYKNNPVCVLD